jgi:4-amino-4-deoxy-L-arabinose transferase-like glycosyltransferase
VTAPTRTLRAEEREFREAQRVRRNVVAALSEPRRLVLLLLFVTAFALRVVHIDQPPLDFHAVRQYNSLLIARDYYYDLGASAPDWQRELASLNRERQATWEPPILPALTALGYRAVGGEHLWIPRMISALSWLVGALFLYLVARRLAPREPDAALASTAVFLFLPFGVAASRSTQPDSMMVAGALASIYMILRYHARPSTPNLLVGAAVTALAVLTKGVSVFLIAPVFLFAGLATAPGRRVLTRRLGVFFGAALLPALGFYAYGIFGSGSLAGVARGDILPQLWTSASFWSGWADQARIVVGYPLVVVSLLGTMLVRPGLPRSVLLGLWTGYLALGLVFTFTISTHDYWNLPLLPIVSLAVGLPIAVVIRAVRNANPGRLGQAALGVILLGSIVLAAGVARARPLDASLERRVHVAEEIGALVRHSKRTVFLSGDYGLPLEYHGLVSGVPWPLASDFEWEELAGVRPKTVEQRFADLPEEGPLDYFIVFDRYEYGQQPALRTFLAARYPLVARGHDYLIFDLGGRRAIDLARASAAVREP